MPGNLQHIVWMLFGLFAPANEGVIASRDWPEKQRLPSRLGLSGSAGPQSSSIAWRIRADPTEFSAPLYEHSGVVDAAGRLFIGHREGVSAIDIAGREVVWTFSDSLSVLSSPSTAGDLVVFGSDDDTFYCVDAETGELRWTRDAAPHPNRGNVVDENGVVYYASQEQLLYARKVEDGSEVWTHEHGDNFNAAPALDGRGRLFIGGFDLAQWIAFDTADGSEEWTFQIGSIPAGMSPVTGGRVYVHSVGQRKLFCMDAETGEGLWEFDTEAIAIGSAIAPDGSIYVLATGGSGWLFKVSPDGQELWRFPLTDESANQPPICDADGNVYFCTWWLNDEGWMRAVSPAGEELWTKEMPDRVAASPTLTSDGTLFVMCEDKFLYAFKDPLDTPLPADVEVTRGTLLFGDVTALHTPGDKNWLGTRSEPGLTAFEPNVSEILIGAHTDALEAEYLELSIDSLVNHPTGTAKVFIRNFQTGSLELIDTYQTTSVMDTHTIHDLDATDHIRQSDGRIELAIRDVVIATFTAQGFDTYFDHLGIGLE